MIRMHIKASAPCWLHPQNSVHDVDKLTASGVWPGSDGWCRLLKWERLEEEQGGDGDEQYMSFLRQLYKLPHTWHLNTDLFPHGFGSQKSEIWQGCASLKGLQGRIFPCILQILLAVLCM